MGRLNTRLPAPSRALDQLYLRTLTREPTESEKQLCRDQTPEAIVFALINSNEFFFNH